MIYTESVTNPLLQVSDIPSLSKIARKNGLLLLVDNTFSPMMLTPAQMGADIVVYSMTKFINGKNDCVAGAICGSEAFVNDLSNVNDGTAMLLGPVFDPMRSSSILKNLHTLHVRMRQHSSNAMYVAEGFEALGLKVSYPGLPGHPQHVLLKSMMNEGYGYGGMVSLDLGNATIANEFMRQMQMEGVGYWPSAWVISRPFSAIRAEVPLLKCRKKFSGRMDYLKGWSGFPSVSTMISAGHS